MTGNRRKVAIIGAGNMAEGILHAALTNDQLRADQVVATDISEPRRELFEKRFGIATTSDNQGAVQDADTVLLAVKPQTFRTVAAEIAEAITQRHLVISIMAGVPTALIESLLGGGARVVRVMPNLPIHVGAGIAAVYKGQFASDEDLAFVRQLFEAGGEAIVVEDEGLIDAVTAVSGSGPAYFYYFVEAITAGGVAAGLRPDQALALAEYACLGAARMMIETKERPADLRRKVTSPGGTTQAAIEYMDSRDVAKNITAAVLRAFDRARQLSQG